MRPNTIKTFCYWLIAIDQRAFCLRKNACAMLEMDEAIQEADEIERLGQKKCKQSCASFAPFAMRMNSEHGACENNTL